MSLYMLLFAVAISYLILVRTLRYRRISQLQAQHGAISTQFADLKYKDAQKILGQMGLYEFPWVFLAGKDFAFLRAFAIPGISKVSVAAKEMVNQTGKRYADTTVLVGEFLVNDIDSERACIAINRMNWIHSRYGSKIKMDQMVYTLCLLTCEALQWIDRYDWRPTTALEKHASWVFWDEVGRRMGLKGVPASFETCAEFIEEFEKKNMAPSDDNALIAKGVFALYASTLPAFLTPVVHAVLIAFMDSRLSSAFKISAPPTNAVRSLLEFLLDVRKYFVRHFMPPRYSTLQVFGEENAAGYRPMMFWEIEPWPEGYKLQEIGPRHLEGKGGGEVMSFVKKGGARSFTTFGQFDGAIYTSGRCPMVSGADTTKSRCPIGFEQSPKTVFANNCSSDLADESKISSSASQVAHAITAALPMVTEL
ncbi:duf2236 family protein [Stemphylium lycopersici]|nr:duf2236 family protein [Stemphylium lycopersici]